MLCNKAAWYTEASNNATNLRQTEILDETSQVLILVHVPLILIGDNFPIHYYHAAEKAEKCPIFISL